jgi:hypothetical protein
MEWLNVKPEVVAAFLSALAALAAAYTAFKGPENAARMAEKIRRENEEVAERRSLKMKVFSTLMEERAEYHSSSGVRALNLVDIAFVENQRVRDAWAELFLNLNGNRRTPQHELDRLFRMLLVEIARDLNLGDGLRLADLERIYHPVALRDANHLAFLERQSRLKQLTSAMESPSANSIQDFNAGDILYPPKPVPKK